MNVSSMRWMPLSGLLMILALVFAACGGGGSAQDEPFKIGVMESVTGPGETYGNVGRAFQADGGG